ncbi:hypothetical protein [Bradyrhizobium sp. CB3481]|uniref:tetratricopeptide repeat protein n=1 Tax=Bradyrhizobium sp. CB3481 TaxID=3039158 RepID=UPI0024B115CF|nr:hypothetical protein [Bradyrhizobium sp. CB3481]WFU19942.1 hypothetical protein QA643_17225 [Bradyrhizobium sp. CB3481]
MKNVVFVSTDKYGGDHLYRARHQRIAEIVFDKVLTTQKQKYDALLRLLKGINRDYLADNEAFETLMHDATLRSIFSNGDLARELLDAGLEITGGDSFILHQRAVFETQHSDGDLNVALDFINRSLAADDEPGTWTKGKLNTKANILRHMANRANNEVKKSHLRSDANAVLNQIRSKGARDYTLGLNIQIDELVDLLKSASQGSLTDRAIANKIQDIEKALMIARSRSEADPFVLQAEARFRTEVNQDARALLAIKRAYELNNTVTPIALRLARILSDGGQLQEAVDTLSETLSRAPSKELRFELGKLLAEHPELKSGADATSLLESAFDNEDNQLMPRLYLLREYWRSRRFEKYKNLQNDLKALDLPRRLRISPMLIITKDGQPAIFSGKISAKSADYAFVQPGKPQCILASKCNDFGQLR